MSITFHSNPPRCDCQSINKQSAWLWRVVSTQFAETLAGSKRVFRSVWADKAERGWRQMKTSGTSWGARRLTDVLSLVDRAYQTLHDRLGSVLCSLEVAFELFIYKPKLTDPLTSICLQLSIPIPLRLRCVLVLNSGFALVKAKLGSTNDFWQGLLA